MSQIVLTNIDLSRNQLLNAVIHVLGADPVTPAAGQAWYRSDLGLLNFENATTVIRLGRLDQISPPGADLAMAGFKITGLGTPTLVGDAVTKAYADGLAGGSIAWKSPVRAASTAAVALATAFANGQTIDGVVLATGDRILVKDQAAGAENGLYTVNAAGAPTRAADADADAEMRQMAMFVQEGTANADAAFVMTNNGAIVPGTTALVFVQFSGLGQVVAGNGLSKTGATLDVNVTANRTVITADAIDIAATYVGQASITTLGTITTGVWNGTAIDLSTGQVTGTLPLAKGGGYTTAATAKTALGFIGKFGVACAAATSTVVTHNLGSRDVTVCVYRSTTPWDVVITDVEMTSVNTVTVRFAVAPAAGDYNIVVTG